ncbi:uncharacterized protein LOC133744557 [Rosa rugosa]|uniref:uncharacterized protein LOC133744557 n=1 Tax=Rosa rugosa TaxID=74645 RepID=UPI002B40A9BF|nr:uncharacterized protein LOC133744557 [Rosa rugosa]
MEDIAFFNHEFPLSMGVSVAKHRLEILKLAKKENEGGGHRHHPRSISRLGWALIKTKKCFSKYFTRLAFQENEMSSSPRHVADQPEKYQEHWGRSLVRKPKGHEGVKTARSIALSGLLDMRIHERLMMAPNPKSLKLSGPLTRRSTRGSSNRSPKASGLFDGRSYDRLMVTKNRSPKLSGPLDGRVTPYEKERVDVDFDDHSLWTAMFQDIKPT